jgi:hypothetical protein
VTHGDWGKTVAGRIGGKLLKAAGRRGELGDGVDVDVDVAGVAASGGGDFESQIRHTFAVIPYIL